MFFSLLLAAPLIALVWLTVILLSLSFHEFSHAVVAKILGDDTAERMGRLTLNPIAHIDPLGILPLLLFGFGWAKPVPYNPTWLSHPERASVLIALAGPLSNALVAVFAGLVLRGFISSQLLPATNLLIVFLILLIIANLSLAIFNLIPIPPLDGSKLLDAVFAGPQWARFRLAIAVHGPQVLLFLVLLSLFTPFDPFFFLSYPVHAGCDAFAGSPCLSILNAGF